MFQLKLVNGLSYFGGLNGKIRATKANPFVTVDEEEKDFLLSTGYFVLHSVVEKPINEEVNIDKMKTEELKVYAEQMGIDISECKTNEERRAVIHSALDADEQDKDPFNEE